MKTVQSHDEWVIEAERLFVLFRNASTMKNEIAAYDHLRTHLATVPEEYARGWLQRNAAHIAKLEQQLEAEQQSGYHDKVANLGVEIIYLKACTLRDWHLSAIETSLERQELKITKLEQQLEATHKDAARYQWLRSRDFCTPAHITPRTADATIDAAIEASKG